MDIDEAVKIEKSCVDDAINAFSTFLNQLGDRTIRFMKDFSFYYSACYLCRLKYGDTFTADISPEEFKKVPPMTITLQPSEDQKSITVTFEDVEVKDKHED
jgi:hypothetical protein